MRNVTYQSHSGNLYVTAKSDKKAFISLSYLSVASTHILEAIIRLNFKNWAGRFSGLLGD